MNRKLVWGLVIILCIGVIVWVTSRQQANRQAKNNVADSGKVIIKVLDKLPPLEQQTPQQRRIWELQQEFAKRYPEIEVIHESQLPFGDASTWTQTLTTALVGSPDLTVFTGGVNPAIYRSLAQKGYFADITEYMEDWPDFQKVNPTLRDFLYVDGKIYGVLEGTYDLLLLAYHKDLFVEAGLDPQRPPQNWKELAQYAAKLTDPQKKQYGFTILGTETADWWFDIFVKQAGGELTNVRPNGEVELMYTEEAVVEALQYWSDLVFAHKAVQSNPLIDINQIFQDWVQKRAAMTIFSPYWLTNQIKMGLKPHEINLSPLPRNKEAATVMAFQTWVINAKASKEQVEAAVKYMQFMKSHENAVKNMEWNKENNVQTLALSVYDDIKYSDYFTGLPAEWLPAIEESKKIARLEYFGKEMFSQPLVKAIQNVLLTPNADIPALLKAAEEETYREYVNTYNETLKSK